MTEVELAELNGLLAAAARAGLRVEYVLADLRLPPLGPALAALRAMVAAHRTERAAK